MLEQTSPALTPEKEDGHAVEVVKLFARRSAEKSRRLRLLHRLLHLVMDEPAVFRQHRRLAQIVDLAMAKFSKASTSNS